MEASKQFILLPILSRRNHSSDRGVNRPGAHHIRMSGVMRLQVDATPEFGEQNICWSKVDLHAGPVNM